MATTEDADVLVEAQSLYQKTWGRSLSANPNAFWEETWGDILSDIHPNRLDTTNSEDGIVNLFSVDAILHHIGTYLRDKSCGDDGVHIIFLKALSKSHAFVTALSGLFRTAATLGVTPF